MPGWDAWPGSSPFLITPAQPPIYMPPSHEGSYEAPSGLFFLPIPIALWDSNTFAMDDANTSRFIILSRWVILPTPTTRSPTGGNTIPA
ncbi:hypothetical protein J1N35_002286 [Gossypium stocksii]|uniref:Uncharacterized protein n=1 Tax=Gossypium stocksii TaxID=47602 RepID=A0A9D4ANA3_9ROSI|nr:hypothetical protein J1N35_002286 [Gossypium stocksii]